MLYEVITVDDFVKKSSLISFSRQGLQRLGKEIVYIAELEGLQAHGRSVSIRLES